MRGLALLMMVALAACVDSGAAQHLYDCGRTMQRGIRLYRAGGGRTTDERAGRYSRHTEGVGDDQCLRESESFRGSRRCT